jgi:hypothetical protein
MGFLEYMHPFLKIQARTLILLTIHTLLPIFSADLTINSQAFESTDACIREQGGF